LTYSALKLAYYSDLQVGCSSCRGIVSVRNAVARSNRRKRASEKVRSCEFAAEINDGKR
jgi:hypothetical protein